MGWPIRMPSTVYAIRCIHNGKVYVGCTQNLKRRMKEHLYELKKGMKRHGLEPTEFQKDFNRYGEFAFEVYVLEKDVPPNLAKNTESKWIVEYRATDPNFGYNKRIGVYTEGFNVFKEGRPPLANEAPALNACIDRKGQM